jgi:hypothetical protein
MELQAVCSVGDDKFPEDDEALLLLLCPKVATTVVRRERRSSQMPIASLQDVTYCCEVCEVAYF